MSKRQKVQETIFNGNAGGEWPPENPAGFIAWFTAHIERIPPEHRDSATIEISTQDEYCGQSSANIEITYMREETDKQMNNRLVHEDIMKQLATNKEKALLATLLAKYGAPPK